MSGRNTHGDRGVLPDCQLRWQLVASTNVYENEVLQPSTTKDLKTEQCTTVDRLHCTVQNSSPATYDAAFDMSARNTNDDRGSGFTAKERASVRIKWAIGKVGYPTVRRNRYKETMCAAFHLRGHCSTRQAMVHIPQVKGVVYAVSNGFHRRPGGRSNIRAPTLPRFF
jgi:hypothetical protein